MFARVAVAKGSPQAKTAGTARASRSGYFGRQSEIAQPEVSSVPKFSWNFGNIALPGPSDRNRPDSGRVDGAGAMQRAGPLPWPMQAKLEVGASDDPLEREANQAAKQVMRMPDEVAFTPPAVKGGGSPGLQGKCSCGGTCPQCRGEKSDEEHGSIRRKPAGPRLSRLGSSPAHSGMTAPPSVHEVLNSPGRPLDSATRAFMEPRFGYDFSSVRLHTGAAARSSAVNVGALAYTVGRHVALREESAPRELLAHELAHVVQQDSAPAPLVQRDDGKQGSSAPQTPGLEARLNVIVEEGPAIQSRLDQIMRTGGPVPQQTKVIGAAIIDVEGYTGPKEMRAISGADTDALGAGAAVYHASSPNPRTLSATRSIAGSGPRRDFPFAHINDAEMKLFEDIIARLPKDARGTIHFATIRVRQVNGQTVFEAYPACSGCIRASFETAGSLPKIELVSHAPVHPTGTANMGNAQAPHSEHDEPITNPQGLKPGSVHMSPRDADVDPATGRVVPGPNTDAAGARRAQNPPSKPPVAPDAEGHAASPPGRYTGAAIGIGTTIATLGLGWLAAYLKAKVDQKIAQRQIDAFREVARKKINANPDEALKKMMINPEGTVYAWVHLDSAVITTFGVDNISPEPTPSDSSPMLNLGPIEYMTAPVDQAVVDRFPQISGGGRHVITVRTILIDIPLVTPPLEDLISYAKSRQLPLDDVHKYVLGRLQGALSSSELALDARQHILNAFQSTNDAFNRLQADFKIAQKRKDVELQKKIAEKMLSVSQSSTSIAGQLKPIGELIQKADEKLKYWQHILDLVKPAGSRP